MELLQWIENLGFLRWLHEAPTVLAYPTILALHSFGMAFLVGISTMISLRVLGFAPGLPLAPLEKFYPLMTISFWVNAVSGVVLFALAAASFAANPVFYIKMLAIAGAVVNTRLLRASVFGDPANLDARPVPMKGKILAVTSLGLWLVAILAGRLTAYYGYVVWQTVAAVLILMAVVLIVRYAAARFLNSLALARHARVAASADLLKN